MLFPHHHHLKPLEPLSPLFLWVWHLIDIPHIRVTMQHVSLSSFFHLGPSMLSQNAGFPSFSQLNNIALYIYATSSLAIHLLIFRLFPYLVYCKEHGDANNLFNIPFSFPLYIFPEVALLDHMGVLLLIFCEIAIFFIVAVRIHWQYTSFLFSTFSPTLVIFCLFDDSCIPTGVR